MKEGIVPPRLEGGVINALPGGGVKRLELAFVGVEDAIVEANDFSAVERGMEEGETLRAKTE
jgi:hypothetical protein